MAYQITLPPEQYEAISAAAAQAGKTVEELALETLAVRFPPVPASERKRPLTQREFLEQLYREGVISNIPTGEPDSPEMAAERKRLAESVGPGKSLSEIVIEDRGLR